MVEVEILNQELRGAYVRVDAKVDGELMHGRFKQCLDESDEEIIEQFKKKVKLPEAEKEVTDDE